MRNHDFQAAESGQTLASCMRSGLPGTPWKQVKASITAGKVFVDGSRELDPARRLSGGERVALKMAARHSKREQRPRVTIVYEDNHLVVIDKPAGVSSVPFEKTRETDTAMDLIRDAWRQTRTRRATAALYVVHRIDRATSGLLIFALTRQAERGLSRQFREHTTERTYICVAQGRVPTGRMESHLVTDRGDGIRGSAHRRGLGKRAVTHVKAIEYSKGATLCEVRLETGRTHQIRIHLAERGHPLLGETVYNRDFLKTGRTALPSRRLMLHAHTLGFVHPVSGERLAFSSPVPADFKEWAPKSG